MARDLYQNVMALADAEGVLKALEGVEVHVYLPGTTTEATIFSGRTGSTQVTNPILTGVSGAVEFYADYGAYDIKVHDTEIPARVADRTVLWNAVSGEDAGIPASKIPSSAIATAKLADDAVTNAKMTDNSVNSNEITNSAVTTVKLADDAVTAAKLADNAVTADHILAGNVSDAEIADQRLWRPMVNLAWGRDHLTEANTPAHELATGTWVQPAGHTRVTFEVFFDCAEIRGGEMGGYVYAGIDGFSTQSLRGDVGGGRGGMISGQMSFSGLTPGATYRARVGITIGNEPVTIVSRGRGMANVYAR